MKLLIKRIARPAPTNPSTSHEIDVKVTSQRTSEKQKQPEVDQESQYMANTLSRFAALHGKNEQS